MNVVAEEMLSRTDAGAFAVKFKEYFEQDEWPELHSQSLKGWVFAQPLSADAKHWQVRSKEIENSGVRVWAILASADTGLKYTATNLRLLGFGEAPPTGLEDCGHVLIVDDLSSVRRLAGESVRQNKLFCHTVDNYAEALKVFGDDPNITHVLFDYSITEGDPSEVIKKMKEIRPKVCIIGSGLERYRENFKELQINYFLPKPWDNESFIDLLLDINTKDSRYRC